MPRIRKEAVKGRFSFRSRPLPSAAALALFACATPEAALRHERSLARLAALEDLDPREPADAALGVALAHELLLVDPEAPALARLRAAERLAAWIPLLRALRPTESGARQDGGGDPDQRRDEALTKLLAAWSAIALSTPQTAEAGRGEEDEVGPELSALEAAVALGALRGGGLASLVRALATSSALLPELRAGELRDELARTCFALAEQAAPAVLAEALRRRDPRAEVRAALAEGWLAAEGELGFAPLFAACAGDASEEMRRTLVAAASRRSAGELAACGALAWLEARAQDESSPSSRLAARALRALGVPVGEKP